MRPAAERLHKSCRPRLSTQTLGLDSCHPNMKHPRSGVNPPLDDVFFGRGGLDIRRDCMIIVNGRFGIPIILCLPVVSSSPIELDNASSAKIVMKTVPSAFCACLRCISQMNCICRKQYVDSEPMRSYSYGLLLFMFRLGL